MFRRDFLSPWCILPGLWLAGCTSSDSAEEAQALGPTQSEDIEGPWSDVDAGSVPDRTPPELGRSVKARFFHGIPNLGILRVCHDPDYVADDPSTVGSELDFGPLPAAPLDVAMLYSYVMSYRSFGALRTGALTFHGGAPSAEDGNCDVSDLEAVLPLPFNENMLPMSGSAPAVDRDADAGTAALDALGVLPTFASNYPVTVFGSGVALDALGLDAYAASSRETYLRDHPGDEEGATKAGALARAQLVGTRGPMFLIAEERPVIPEQGAFALHAAHLVVDVPTSSTGVGELRVCVTSGTVERPALPARDEDGLRFRTRTTLGKDFADGLPYRFRFYAREAFDEEAKGCAATSIKPIAQLELEAGELKREKSYTLVVTGASASALLYSPKGMPPVFRASAGVRSVDEIEPKVVVLEDAL